MQVNRMVYFKCVQTTYKQVSNVEIRGAMFIHLGVWIYLQEYFQLFKCFKSFGQNNGSNNHHTCLLYMLYIQIRQYSGNNHRRASLQRVQFVVHLAVTLPIALFQSIPVDFIVWNERATYIPLSLFSLALMRNNTFEGVFAYQILIGREVLCRSWYLNDLHKSTEKCVERKFNTYETRSVEIGKDIKPVRLTV